MNSDRILRVVTGQKKMTYDERCGTFVTEFIFYYSVFVDLYFLFISPLIW